MKIGLCRELDEFSIVELAQAAGADYLEVAFGNFVYWDDAKLEECLAHMKAIGFPCLVAKNFLSGDLTLTGENADFDKLDAYLARGYEWAGKFGLKKTVFGSGAYRRCPDGFPKEKAMEQIVTFTRLAAKYAAKIGAVVAFEPLSYDETNMILTVEDGALAAEASGCTNVGTIADLYHMVNNKDDVENIGRFPGKVLHGHVRDPIGRSFPLPTDSAESQEYYRRFFAYLKAAGCDTCSVECRNDGFEEKAAPCVAYLKELDSKVAPAKISC